MKVVVKKPGPKPDGRPKQPPFSVGDIVLRRGDLVWYGLPLPKNKEPVSGKHPICSAYSLRLNYPYYVKEVRKDGGLILEGRKFPVSPQHVFKGEHCPKCDKCGLIRSPFVRSCAGCWY